MEILIFRIKNKNLEFKYQFLYQISFFNLNKIIQNSNNVFKELKQRISYPNIKFQLQMIL
jgi:hypothetical protein